MYILQNMIFIYIYIYNIIYLYNYIVDCKSLTNNLLILFRWADLNTAGGSNPKAEHYYDHPFFQVLLKHIHM